GVGDLMQLLGTESESICRICGSREYGGSWSKGDFTYVRCAGCEVVRMMPYPIASRVAAYYEHYLSTKQRENPLYLSEEYWESFKREKDLTFADLGYPLERVRNKRVLDVGCAVGQFMRYMQEHRAACTGIDIS